MGYDRFMSDEEFDQRLSRVERRHARLTADLDQIAADGEAIKRRLEALLENQQLTTTVLEDIDKRIGRLEGIQR